MTSLTSAATIITFTSTSTFNLRVLAITSTDQLASHPSTFSTASTANNVTDSSIFLVNTTCPKPSSPHALHEHAPLLWPICILFCHCHLGHLHNHNIHLTRISKFFLI